MEQEEDEDVDEEATTATWKLHRLLERLQQWQLEGMMAW